MNSFGNTFKVSIFGESHGEALGIVIDGCPAGIYLAVEDFLIDIERRKGGNHLATTPRKELDIPLIKSGVFNNKTTGTPILILFENNNTISKDYEAFKQIARPGHADFVANKKFKGYNDHRGGGHFSGRLTLCLVAAGVVAKKIIAHIKIEVNATVCQINGNSNVEQALAHAIAINDSVGGIIECKASNLPIGLGEPFFDSIESLLSHAIFSIPAVKGIEFGNGFEATKLLGSQNNDVLVDQNGTTATNNCGGIVGGLSNGNELIFKVAIKPTSSTPQQQESYNVATNSVEKFSIKGRHDLCIALRVPVVVEAATAIVLANFAMQQQLVPLVIINDNSFAKVIYHITSLSAFSEAKEKGFYEAASLPIEGFIHCSTAQQVNGVLERYFSNKTNLVKLFIDVNKLTNKLVYEHSASINEAFPHVFGPINLDAIFKYEIL
jgi:chorismate synthase